MIYSFTHTNSHLSGKVYDVTEFLDGELPLEFLVLWFLFLALGYSITDHPGKCIPLLLSRWTCEWQEKIVGGSKIILKYAGKDATYVLLKIFVNTYINGIYI